MIPERTGKRTSKDYQIPRNDIDILIVLDTRLQEAGSNSSYVTHSVTFPRLVHTNYGGLGVRPRLPLRRRYHGT